MPTNPAGARWRANLGIALLARFEQTGTRADLDAAIDADRAAADVIPDGHLYRGVLLSNLGNVLRIRFGETGERADLDAAIEASQAAVGSTPPGHADRPWMLSNLGVALRNQVRARWRAG